MKGQGPIFSQVQDILGSLSFFIPELILSGLVVLVLLSGLIRRGNNFPLFCGLTGLLMVLFFTCRQLGFSAIRPFPLFNHMLALDSRAVLFKLLFSIAACITFLFSFKDKGIQGNGRNKSEYAALLIAMLLGLNLMSMSTHLLMIYLSVEMVSVCSYVLATYQVKTPRSSEAGIKYALFGAVASAIMLYGLSLLYGFTGTLDITHSAFLANLSKVPQAGAALAIIMTLAGFAFKISAVPFHFWTPDVYEGAPLPVIAWFSVASKAAGLMLLIRFTDVFTFPVDNYALIWPNFHWESGLAIVAILTMTVGNLSAIAQTNLKRLMAYSSIAHTGFLMMGVLVFSASGEVAVLFYLFIYLLMNFAAFMFIGVISNQYGTESLEDYKGLGLKLPFLSSALIIVLAALTGLPPTAGFVAKFTIFFPVVSTWGWSKSPWLFILLIAGVINTIIALFYYFRVAWYLFLKAPEKAFPDMKGEWLLRGMIILSALALLVIGIFPGALLRFLQSFLVAPSPVFFQPI